MKKIIAMLLALVMVFALCACGSTAAPAEETKPAEEATAADAAPAEETAAEDTVTVMVPPVSGTYQDDIDGMVIVDILNIENRPVEKTATGYIIKMN